MIEPTDTSALDRTTRCRKGMSRGRRLRAAGIVLALTAAVGWLQINRDEWPARVRLPRTSWALGFSPDGSLLATSSPDAITLWDGSSGRRLTTWSTGGLMTSLGAFSPDGRTFAYVEWTGMPQPVSIQRLNVATGQVLSPLNTHSPTPRHPIAFELMFTDDGSRLCMILGDSQRVRERVFWDLATGEELGRHAISCPSPQGGHRAFSRNGRFMAIVAQGQANVTIWDLAADRQHLLLERVNSSQTTSPLLAATCLAFSPDGSTLAVGREDEGLELWDLATSKRIKTLRGHSTGYVPWGKPQFSPDGTILISEGLRKQSITTIEMFRRGLRRWIRPPSLVSEGELIVLDIRSGQRLGRLTSVSKAFLSPDGQTLVSSENDRTVLRAMPAQPPYQESNSRGPDRRP